MNPDGGLGLAGGRARVGHVFDYVPEGVVAANMRAIAVDVKSEMPDDTLLSGLDGWAGRRDGQVVLRQVVTGATAQRCVIQSNLSEMPPSGHAA